MKVDKENLIEGGQRELECRNNAHERTNKDLFKISKRVLYYI